MPWLGIRAVAIVIVVMAAVHPAQWAYTASGFQHVRDQQNRANMIFQRVPQRRVLGVLANSWDPSLSYLLDRDVSIAWDASSIAAADWLANDVRNVAIGFGPTDTLTLVRAPWIGSDDPVSISLGHTLSELRHPTVASTTTNRWTNSADRKRRVACGPEGVSGDLPNATFVIRPVRAGSTALIRFGDVTPIPIQQGAIIRPARQPKNALLVCPLGPIQLLVSELPTRP